MTKTWPDEHEKNRKNRTLDAAGGEIAQERHPSKGRGSEGLSKEHRGLLCPLSLGILPPGPGSAAAVNVHRGQGAVGGQRCGSFKKLTAWMRIEFDSPCAEAVC